MQCDNCGNERFNTIRVHRSRRYDDERDAFLHSNRYDTRIIVCEECGQRVIAQTKATHVITFDDEALQKKIRPLK